MKHSPFSVTHITIHDFDAVKINGQLINVYKAEDLKTFNLVISDSIKSKYPNRSNTLIVANKGKESVEITKNNGLTNSRLIITLMPS